MMKKSIILILILVGVLFVATTLTGLVVNLLPTEMWSSSFTTFITYSLSFILTIVGLSIIGKSLGWHRPSPRPRFEHLNLPLLLLSIITILVLDLVMEPLISLIPDSYLDSMYSLIGGGLWSILTTVIAAPILEEFIFRGYIQKNLCNFTNPYLGIVLASVIFGAIHLIPQQMIMASLIALVIGVIYYLTNSLMTAIAIHLLNNGLTYTLTLFFGGGTPLYQILRIDKDSSTYSVIYYSSIAFLLILGYVAVRRIRVRKQELLSQTKSAEEN